MVHAQHGPGGTEAGGLRSIVHALRSSRVKNAERQSSTRLLRRKKTHDPAAIQNCRCRKGHRISDFAGATSTLGMSRSIKPY